jgi:aldehyde dehydrogenase (NAD+)
MLEKREFYINGGWVAPAAAHDMQVINPSNEEPCAVISLGRQADTDAAVAAAKAAFPGWAATPKEERIALAERILEVYTIRADDMAEAISLEMGAPIDLAKTAQAPSGIGHIKNFIRATKRFEFERMLGAHAPNDRIGTTRTFIPERF